MTENGSALTVVTPSGNGIRIHQDLTLSQLGQTFAQSGFFKDAQQASQAVVKVLAGQELGMGPVAAMRGIHVFEGHVELSGATMAGLLKATGRYRIRTLTAVDDDKKAEIEFFERCDGKWESLGISRYSMEEAKRAGLTGKKNWQVSPADMLWNRAMSRGFRRFAQDVGCAPLYAEGEVREIVDAEATPVAEHAASTASLNEKLRAKAQEPEDLPDLAVDTEAEQERQQLLTSVAELEARFPFNSPDHRDNVRIKYAHNADLDACSNDELRGYATEMQARLDRAAKTGKANGTARRRDNHEIAQQAVRRTAAQDVEPQPVQNREDARRAALAMDPDELTAAILALEAERHMDDDERCSTRLSYAGHAGLEDSGQEDLVRYYSWLIGASSADIAPQNQ